MSVAEQFSKDWHRAVGKFTVLQHRVVGMPEQMTHYIHAEADTGSRYEFLGQDVQIDYRNPHAPSFVVVVMEPWHNVWTAPKGSYIYPDYALERWGNPAKSAGQHHGGDTAALVIGLNMICGATIEEACTFASSFFTYSEEES
jgi:hypothetical protein